MSYRYVVLFVFGILVLSGCAQTASVPTATVAPPSATATILPTETLAPSATPSLTLTHTPTATPSPTATLTATPTPTPTHPMMIVVERQREYPGGQMVIEREVEHRSNYTRYVASYPSDGNKIYALLTLPDGEPPATGWPVILFNHGYIPPAQYTTTGRYIAYADVFARNGYIIVQSDYRGHGQSEGDAGNSFSSTGYTDDVLNALASVKTLPQADPKRIGIWGHSMGGGITLRAMVVSKELKAGVIWAGMVATQAEMITFHRDRGEALPTTTPDRPDPRRSWANELSAIYGSPEENPAFWDSISPTSFLDELSGPLQLHHATGDTSVPLWYSQRLAERLEAAGASYAFYTYEGDNHNLTEHFSQAMARSLAFFDEYVKGE